MPIPRLATALWASALVGAFGVPALADPPAATKPAGPAAGAAAPAAADPVIASVNDQQIHLSDVRAAASQLPQEMRNLPPQMLFPMVVNQLVDQHALVDEAKTEKLQDDPKVQVAMRAAADTALQNALLTRDVGPQITDAKLQAAYQAQYAHKTGQEEVHARHILLPTEAAANDVIKQLHGGADFATLAKKLSTDKETAAQNGGDLGWFKKGDMLPEFSNQAFSMKKGEISAKPVHTTYGWHVIQVLDTRVAPAPSFDSVKDQLRQSLIQAAVREAVNKAVAKVKVVHYNPDGSVQKPTPATAAGKAPGAVGALPAPATPAPGTTQPSND
jgi:peptidyl-prolyl cis-trans isomerase C